jgi:2-iminobutanoate/2-iminopropanoate deaminase
MKRNQPVTVTLSALVIAVFVIASSPARAQEIARFRSSGSAPSTILEAVLLPSGIETLLLSGQTATLPGNPDKPVPPETTPAQLGDTRQQTASILTRIKATLERRGWSMSDIVKLTVYLVGDPAKGGRMDYEGMNLAYREYFGAAANADLVTRETVQIVALAEPAYLVEIQATAARAPKRP